jgi:hypothetical protein
MLVPFYDVDTCSCRVQHTTRILPRPLAQHLMHLHLVSTTPSLPRTPLPFPPLASLAHMQAPTELNTEVDRPKLRFPRPQFCEQDMIQLSDATWGWNDMPLYKNAQVEIKVRAFRRRACPECLVLLSLMIPFRTLLNEKGGGHEAKE